MAEQEVIKHTKKIYKVWNSKEHSFWHKLKEFVIEIFIIVFAVSISIWFHSWSDHRHEQAEVKSFLLGLKKDIDADMEQTKSIVSQFKDYDTIYTYYNRLSKEKIPNKDSLKGMLSFIINDIYLRPHQSRFNGFLSAGKIMTIEEDSLALDILDYYQEILPSIKSSESSWLGNHNNLKEYLVDNVKDIDSDMAKWEVLVTPKGKYLTKSLIPWPQLFERYENLLTSGESIVKQIDELYPDEK